MNSEQKIIESAKEIFQKKGFTGARMQEIADNAGINKALVHYYFRNKEKLFHAVIQELFMEIINSISTVPKEKPLSETLQNIVATYIQFLNKNKFLPSFIVNEINQNPDNIYILIKENISKIPEIINSEFGKISNNKALNQQFIINLISLLIFPYIAEPIFKIILNVSEDDYQNILNERKNLIPDLIINGLISKL